MPASKIIPFQEKGKRKENQEKLSQELLKELTKDTAYRDFKAEEELYRGIGESLGKARKKKKLSAADLARKIGKAEKVISRMERGEYKQYTLKLLLQLARETGSKLRMEFV